jgi:conjugal transfer pilus assembly protein TraW
MPSIRLSAKAATTLFLLGGLCFSAAAESLGSYGQTFAIKEKDAIGVMKEAARKKLENGGQEKMLKDAQARYLASLNNIKLRPGISPKVLRSASRLVDLTQSLSTDVSLPDGTLIAKSGTRYNPLALKPLTKKVFFIDAREKAQLAYVMQAAAPQDKIIVMAGSVITAGNTLKRRVYMDINDISGAMHIKALPSVASQSGLMLKVDEVKL